MPIKHLIVEQGGLAAGSALSTGLAVIAQIDSKFTDSVGKWPVTVVLAAVALVCIYLMYRTTKEHAEAMVRQTEAHHKAFSHQNQQHHEDLSKIATSLNRLIDEWERRPCAYADRRPTRRRNDEAD